MKKSENLQALIDHHHSTHILGKRQIVAMNFFAVDTRTDFNLRLCAYDCDKCKTVMDKAVELTGARFRRIFYDNGTPKKTKTKKQKQQREGAL